jgi:hypothetical protein
MSSAGKQDYPLRQNKAIVKLTSLEKTTAGATAPNAADNINGRIASSKTLQ